jgi:ABC-type glutathione transport system ATPase component
MIDVEGFSVAAATRPDRLILDGIDLHVPAGTRVGIVGESGCGKSTLLRSLTGLPGPGLTVVGGSMLIAGRDLAAMPAAERRALLGSVVAMVPQGVALSLTPHRDVAAHFDDIFRLDGIREGAAARAVPLLDEVGLPGATMVNRFPHELSGGEQQRVLVALGIARDPEVLLLDEPTSALDVGVAHDILSLIEEEHRIRGFTLVCVSHDLGVIRRVADHVVVMNAGRIVEQGPVTQVIEHPTNPYTRRLLDAAPRLDVITTEPVERPALVSASDLTVVRSSASRGMFRSGGRRATTALDSVTFEVRKGEILGVIGESGSGKSTFLKTICGLLEVSGGSLVLDGDIDLTQRVKRRSVGVVRRIQMVFQNPDDSLNPAHTVRRILAAGRSRREASDGSLGELLRTVGLGPAFLDRRPPQLSGGEKQRVAIARALAQQPELLLLDEVTSALDVTVQSEVLDTLRSIHREMGTTMVFVSHDLAVVASVAERIVVLRNGRLVEVGDVAHVLDHPTDPYTSLLVGLARGDERG